MTPEQRTLRARIAANVRWSRVTDRSAATESARAAALLRFERQVDPTGTLPPAERSRRARNAQAAHMHQMQFARSKKAG